MDTIITISSCKNHKNPRHTWLGSISQSRTARSLQVLIEGINTGCSHTHTDIFYVWWLTGYYWVTVDQFFLCVRPYTKYLKLRLDIAHLWTPHCFTIVVLVPYDVTRLSDLCSFPRHVIASSGQVSVYVWLNSVIVNPKLNDIYEHLKH